MYDFIFSTYWGDSASYIASIENAVPESITTILVVLFRNNLTGVTIFNIQLLLGSLVTLAGGYYVGIKLFNNKLLAIFLSLIILLAPLRVRYSMEWAVLTYWGYYIVFIYCIYNYIKTSSWKSLLVAGLTFGLSFTEQPYIGVILSIISGISLTVFVAFSKNKNYLKQLFILFGTLILFGIPGLHNVYKERYINDLNANVNFSSGTRSESNRWAYSAKPWNYIIPDIRNPILGDMAVKANYWIWDHPPYYLTEPFFPKEHTLYLGFTLILLSLHTIYFTYIRKVEFFLRRRDLVLFLIIVFIVAFVFSMPPYIAYNGFRFYFPGEFMYEILPQFRAYARFGAIVFISNAILAVIFVAYIIENKLKWRFSILPIIVVAILIEFSTPYLTNRISAQLTEPYKWLSGQEGDFSYLEIPRRIDYTDVIYQDTHGKKLLNAYLQTPEYIAEIEKNIVNGQGDTKALICNRFSEELGGKYIMYHDKEIYKDTLITEFIQTRKVTSGVKIALEESWGEPAWGNHIPKSPEDLKKTVDRNNLLDKLKNDPRFTLVKEFERGEIDKDTIYNANDLDKVTIFELNPSYCN